MIKDSQIRQFISSYLTTNNQDFLLPIFIEAISIAKYWIEENSISPGSEHQNPIEIAAEFVLIVKSKALTTSAINTIRNLVTDKAKKISKINYFNEQFNAKCFLQDVDSFIIAEESFKEAFADVEPRLAAFIFYILKYPEELDNVLKIFKNNLVDLFIIMDRYHKLKEIIIEQPSSINDLVLTDSSKILMLSSIYNVSQELLILFLLFKDINKFLQFCLMFSGKTIKIPEFDDLIKTIQTSAEISKSLNDNVLKLSKIPDLLNITTNEEYKLNPIMSEFLSDILSVISKNYEGALDKLVNSVKPDNAESVYNLLNKEYAVQSNLLKGVLEAIESKDSLDKLTGQLKDRG